MYFTKFYKSKYNKGSVTVEACLTLPLFLFFFMAVASMIMIFFAEGHIHQSLVEAGEEVSKQCYWQQQYAQGTGESIYLNQGVLKNRFLSSLGEDFYVSHVVAHGKNGIILTISVDHENPKIFLIDAGYDIRFDIPIIGNFCLHRVITVKQKGFVGYTQGEEKVDAYVYVTPNQAVYHCSRNCTHLALSVSALDGSNRNLYKPCRLCKNANHEGGKIYVARTSDIYHENRNCSGLKRSVIRMKKSSVIGLPPCERCGR